jgi:hypothetical protein
MQHNAAVYFEMALEPQPQQHPDATIHDVAGIYKCNVVLA